MKTVIKYLKTNGKQVGTVLFLFMITGAMMNGTVTDFQASILGTEQSDPFSGTTSPVKRVPSWVDLTSSEWKLPYDQIPQSKFIDLPSYIPSQLTIPMSSLNFSNAADKAIRNAQVTFSVPYMGNYELDGREYAGSHLAVDLKIPSGTPIYSIANGIVVKAANQSGGFGYHVVIRHDNVPSLGDQNTMTTYYSGYAHLSSYNVTEGQKVSKGQQIGVSGDTGTATTPHLHFQIDNDQAPWHPYWPFTSKEASDAGYSFWEAINAGLGKDKALQTTISPMAYVQQYMTYDGGGSITPSSSNNNTYEPSNGSSSGTVSTEQNSTDELPPMSSTESTGPINVSGQPSVAMVEDVPDLASIELQHNQNFRVGTEMLFKVIALDKDSNVIEGYQPISELHISIENGSASLNKTFIGKGDFVGGIAEFKLTPTAEFGIRIKVSDGTVSAMSEMIQPSSFSDVNEADDSFVAINFLKNNDIVKGYADGSFKPDNPVSRVEALKFIYEGLNKEVKTRVVLEFTDTDSKAWYARYIAAAQLEGVVKGYSGNIFKPANPVTRAEFVKMLVEAAGYNGENYVPLKENFSDVKKSDWYYSYVGLAKDKNLIDSSSNLFRPNEAMTRGEVSEILYKTILLQVTRSRSYDKTVVVNPDDVNDFYRQV